MFLDNASRRFRFLVFDWDGTLADSTQLIVRAVQNAYRDVGLPVPDEHAASYIIGLRLDEAFRVLSPTVSQEKAEKIRERYLFHYLKKDDEIPLFDGIRELLTDLDNAGYYLGVATGKSRKGLDRMLRYHNLGHRFHATRTADEGASKPSPEMLLNLVDRVGVNAQQTLMIGDTTHDVLMAHNARASALAVTYGAHDPATLKASAPEAMVDSVSAIRHWLECNG